MGVMKDEVLPLRLFASSPFSFCVSAETIETENCGDIDCRGGMVRCQSSAATLTSHAEPPTVRERPGCGSSRQKRPPSPLLVGHKRAFCSLVPRQLLCDFSFFALVGFFTLVR